VTAVNVRARLTTAREAYARRDWVAARDGFLAAGEGGELTPEDRVALANSAWWLGDLALAVPALTEAHHDLLDAGEPTAAALVALDVGYTALLRGDDAQASGWFGRARHLLAPLPEGEAHGYLRIIDAEVAFDAGDLDTAYRLAEQVGELGERTGDATLTALAAVGKGRVRVRQGRLGEGGALLDEAMVVATSDRLDPAWTGNIYCHLMFACFEIADLGRAGEWTEVTARWCERMPGAGPFLGICRVHRAQVLRLRGEWSTAERELVRVQQELAHFARSVVAEAHYQLGELHRLRRHPDEATARYEEAHRLGRDPQPGLALLALERGRPAAAFASLRAAVSAAGDTPLARADLLPAAVEVAVAAGELPSGRVWAEELAALAATYGTVGFEAEAGVAAGRLHLAEGEAGSALRPLRRAAAAWRRLGATVPAAQAAGLLAAAYDAVGDHDAARLEQRVVDEAMSSLGTDARARDGRRSLPDGLTAREAEVLGLAADGRSNQQIADELVLSVRTVERHLATVYQKLDLHGRSARAAAVSYAHRQDLLPRR
jgi:ATP/maltotriose-dependent transcriptional regulator MalT